MTATASPRVREDLCVTLQTRAALVLMASFNRANLQFEVVEKPQQHESSIQLVRRLLQQRFRNDCGIVYCLSRSDCQTLASRLQVRP